MKIREQLNRLVELQVAELDLRRLEATLADLPARQHAAEQRIEQARARIAEAEARREDNLKDRRQLEGQLQDIEAKVEKYREQEMLVKTNEQLWALQAEIRQSQQQAGAIEERILEEMESADALRDDIGKRQEELAQIEAEVAAQLVELEQQRVAWEQQRQEAGARIASIGAQIGEDLLALYGRVKGVRGGVAVAEARDGTCLACNVRLRPQLYLEVLNMDRPVQCDNCKRILFSREALELPSSVQIVAAH